MTKATTLSTCIPQKERFTSGNGAGLYMFVTARTVVNEVDDTEKYQDDNAIILFVATAHLSGTTEKKKK